MRFPPQQGGNSGGGCRRGQALGLLEERDFDAVLLDIMMPNLDGLSVCRAVRKTNDVPIILLTALSDEEDKLLGYELGADDYVTKPFTMAVLYAKLGALIRRRQGSVRTGDRLEVGGIILDQARQRVYAGRRETLDRVFPRNTPCSGA